MRLILSFILCLFITSPLSATSSFANDYETGKQAYDAGDYKTAYEIWLPLAEAGDTEANIDIGLLMYKGLYLELNKAKAQNIFRESILKSPPRATYLLGVTYIQNWKKTSDIKKGLKWIFVGYFLKYKNAIHAIETLLPTLDFPKEVIEEARRNAKQWLNENIHLINN